MYGALRGGSRKEGQRVLGTVQNAYCGSVANVLGDRRRLCCRRLMALVGFEGEKEGLVSALRGWKLNNDNSIPTGFIHQFCIPIRPSICLSVYLSISLA